MNGILGCGALGREVELTQYHVIDMRILLQPLATGHLIGVIIYMIEHASLGR